MSAPRARSCLALFFACVLWQGVVRSDDVRKRPPPSFTVAKETTYFVGPLDGDGYVDYVAAINQHFSRGVTPENNANVLYWRATGPVPEGMAAPPGLFKLLGIEPPPKKGHYYRGLATLLTEVAKIKADDPQFTQVVGKEQSHAMSKPWHEGMFPHLGVWQTFNAEPLATVVEGTKRSESYTPVFHPRDSDRPRSLGDTILYGMYTRITFGHALAARAMLHLGEGRREAAWDDIQACHRLARHIAQSPWLIEYLWGVDLDGVASAADLAFLRKAELTAEQAATCLKDRQALPRWPSVADNAGVTERVVFLDSMQLVVRHGRDGLDAAAPSDVPPPDWVEKLNWNQIDWNEALRLGNQWLDRYAEAIRIDDRRKMLETLAELNGKLQSLKAELQEAKLPASWAADPQTRKTVSQRLGAYLFLQSHAALGVASTRGNTESRVLQSERNVEVALALAAHRAATGRYPAKLAELSPRYLKRVPDDLFAGRPLVYSAAENAYILYSVGENGIDDLGRGDRHTPPGDDLVIRIPSED